MQDLEPPHREQLVDVTGIKHGSFQQHLSTILPTVQRLVLAEVQATLCQPTLDFVFCNGINDALKQIPRFLQEDLVTVAMAEGPVATLGSRDIFLCDRVPIFK